MQDAPSKRKRRVAKMKKNTNTVKLELNDSDKNTVETNSTFSNTSRSSKVSKLYKASKDFAKKNGTKPASMIRRQSSKFKFPTVRRKSKEKVVVTSVHSTANSVTQMYREKKIPSVLVLYTGGTIGMVPDPSNGNTLKPDIAFIQKELDSIIEMNANSFTISLHKFNEVIDSSDITIEIWIKIAELIEKNYDKHDGFVIIMGTDTMAYTASAMSYMLENLTKPVVFTGALIPLFKPNTDARRNLLISIDIAARSKVPEVCVFFHDDLFRGNRTKKLKSDDLDAFESPNFPHLGKYVNSLKLHKSLIFRQDSPKKFKIHKKMTPNFLVVKVFPGLHTEILKAIVSSKKCRKRIKCIVLELYGMGNFPSRTRSLISVLKKAVENGVIIIVCTQCAYGSVELGAYEVGKVLSDLGAIGAKDMTVEAVTTKLSFLLGAGYIGDELKEMFNTNLRGEITDMEFNQF